MSVILNIKTFWQSLFSVLFPQVGWQYRYKYDNARGKWVIELWEFHEWKALVVVEDNRLKVKEFVSMDAAENYVETSGIGKVYKYKSFMH